MSSSAQRWQQAKSIFYQALDLPEKERPSWVEGACRGDPSLRAEVEALISNHAAAGEFLEPSPADPHQSAAPGDVLAGRFRIVRLIGAGGMGEVYEAEDLSSQLTVALKTIGADMARDSRLTARLRNELVLARNVSHPNVCKVYEYWDTEHDGRRLVFFTMEVLSGETLAQRIAEHGPLPAREALAILRQVAAGLEAVHHLGIVHRDLKPANVMLVPEPDGTERAVLMDFGLARAPELSGPHKTQTGLLMGTPSYMAPELFEGREAGIPADVYSFGVMALEIVTGSNCPLVSPRSLVPKLHAGWDQILRCFDRDPARRPSTPTSVIDAIERAGRRRRWLAVAAGFAFVSLAAVVFAWTRFDRSPVRALAVQQLTFDPGFTADPAVSADGKFLVYSSDRNSQGDLNIWLQKMATGETRQLTDDPGDEDEPAISPDGTQFAWRSVADHALYSQPVAGGQRRLIARYGEAPRYSPDGSKLLYWTGVEGEHTAASAQIWVAPVQGGAPRRLAADFLDARTPAWSPDGRKILFRGARSAQPSVEANREWYIVNLDGSGLTATGAGPKLRAAGLLPHDSPVTWDGSHVIFTARAGHVYNLWSLGLYAFLGRTIGAPRAITTSSAFQAVPALFPDGRIAYAIWREQLNLWQISTADAAMRQVTFHDAIDTRVSVSRDGRTLAFGRRLGETRDVWIKDMVAGSERVVARNELAIPFLSPGGGLAALSIGPAIRILDIASGAVTNLCAQCGELLGWLPDESAVLYLQELSDGTQAITAFDRASSTQRILVSGRGLREASISPDGQLIAFSVRSGGIHSRIFVARLANADRSSWLPLTPETGWADKPIWSDDGRSLYYKSDRDGFHCIWSQRIQTHPLLLSGDARPLRHFHKITFTLSHLPPTAMGVAQARGNLFLTVDSDTSNIWSIQN